MTNDHKRVITHEIFINASLEFFSFMCYIWWIWLLTHLSSTALSEFAVNNINHNNCGYNMNYPVYRLKWVDIYSVFYDRL